MTLIAGARLGPYEVLSTIGSGGMGHVYKARDTRLDRIVAVKVLLPEFASDPDRRARFEREARAIAALSHPNICTVHDVGREPASDSQPAIEYLVMEYLEGETLADRLVRIKGPLPLDQALTIGIAISDALDKAHRAGVVHRDLKPANIILTKKGPKLLDFGLAKIVGTPAIAMSVNASTRTARPATAKGTILGTIHYMAPEQVEGHEADSRSDIWALGVLLYEMTTGNRPFDGESAASVVSAILKDTPVAVSARQPLAPSALDHVVTRCLERDVDERWQDARDVTRELTWIAGSSAGAGAAAAVVARPDGRERLVWLAALVSIGMIAVALAWRAFQPAPSPPQIPVVRFDVQTPPTDDPLAFALSPDGRQLAFVANDPNGTSLVWIRSLDTTVARPLVGTEGATSSPFWSPDSRTIGFFAARKLRKIDLAGGAPQDLADAPNPRGGAWSRDGVILFAPTNTGGLVYVRATGGPLTSVVESIGGKRSFGPRLPQFLPDGRHFLFFVQLGGPEEHGIYLGNLDGTEPTRLLDLESAAAFAAPGSLLVRRQSGLFAVPFEPVRGTVVDEPRLIAEDLARDPNGGSIGFSISSTGLLASRGGRAAQRRQFVWADRFGRILSPIGAPDDGSPASPELAPDERYVAFYRNEQSNLNVWMLDVARGLGNPFTTGSYAEINPLWSDKGQRVVYGSNEKGVYDLFEKHVAGGENDQPVLFTAQEKRPVCWSSDGRFVLYTVVTSQNNRDLWALPMTGDRPVTGSDRSETVNREAFPVVRTPFDEDEGQFSPDGRWLAFGSMDSGHHEINVQPFPGPGQQARVSAAGGSQVRWRPDGSELYYVSPDGQLMAVGVKASPDGRTLDMKTPVALFATHLATGLNVTGTKPQYAVSRDGRFLMNIRIADDAPTPITIVQNWMAGIRK